MSLQLTCGAFTLSPDLVKLNRLDIRFDSRCLSFGWSTRWRGIVLWRACGEQGILLYICLLT